MRVFLLLLATALLAGAAAAAAAPASALPAAAESAAAPLHPPTRLFATCADYPTQAAAQAAADTRDGDGDGIYCESLPCPCAGPGSSSGESAPERTPERAPAESSGSRACQRPSEVVSIGFSMTKYPTIYAHYERAVADGWPQILAVNRPYADARRDRLLSDYAVRSGRDRDEYPPAVGRGKYRKALMRGTRPRGWQADVAYVPSGENRSHGATLGIKLRRFCDGTLFRYAFY